MADANAKPAPEPTVSMLPHEFASAAPAIRVWGSFRLLELVGQGSFGEVYRAFDTVLEREVALKLLLPDRLERGEEASALQEARALAKVRHPNVVQVYGVDQHDGRPGFWSDFVRGKTLSTLVHQQGAFGPREVAMIGIDLAKALSAVHGAHLLHRDIKASNAMREEGGRILLMDFGLTHRQDSGGSICGTVPYIAPEMLRGESASVASDIYALGVLLYYLATGKHPFRESSVWELKAAHESGTRPRLLDDRPDVPEPLCRVIETAMDPDPDKRFRSAGQMVSALSTAAGVGSITAVEQNRVTPGRARWIWAAGGVVAIAAGLYWSSVPKKAPEAAPSAQQDYLKAQALLDRYYQPHNIENAIALFQKAVKEDPGLASGFAGLCKAYWRQYRDNHNPSVLDPAKDACNHALQIDREIVSPHVTLASIYIDQGKTDIAAEQLKTALALNKNSPDAFSALADLYQKEGRSADVEPTIQKAVDRAPYAWAFVNQLGLYYISIGKYAAAVEQFQQVTKLNADNANAWNNLGVSYKNEGKLDLAEAAFRKSLGIKRDFGPLSNLGTILEAQGKNTEAADVYKQAVQLNPSRYLSWGNLASALNRIPERKQEARDTYLKAISLAQEAHTKAPDDADVASYLGSYYAALGDSAKSAPFLRQAVALKPDDPRILYRVAEAYELSGNRTDALKWIGRAFAKGLPRQTVDKNPELKMLRADSRFPAQTPLK
jgi:tetratricopeptide (TPR) repeat protein